MESLRSNKALFALLVGTSASALGLALGALPWLSDYLELVELPPSLRESVVSTALVTAAGCYAIEWVAQKLI
jgi:hypothetical protein